MKETKPKELMSQSEYARHIGKTNAYVKQKLVDKGVINIVDRKINCAEADAAVLHFSDPTRGRHGKPSGNGDKSFAQVRTVKETLRAKLLELDLRVRQGELVLAAEVGMELSRGVAACRNRFRAVPSKVMPLIAQIFGVSDRKKIVEAQQLLLREHDEALEDLSKWTLGR